MLTLLTNVPLDTLVSPKDLVTNLVGAERHEIGHLLCWRRPQGHWAVLKLRVTMVASGSRGPCVRTGSKGPEQPLPSSAGSSVCTGSLWLGFDVIQKSQSRLSPRFSQ